MTTAADEAPATPLQAAAAAPRSSRLPQALLLAVTLAIATAYLTATLALPSPALADPLGPQIFPLLVCGGLYLCAVLMMAGLWRDRARSSSAELAAPPFDGRAILMVAAISAWTGLYFLLFERAGFLLANSVFLFGLMSAFHRGHPRTNIACAVGFSFGAWMLFVKALSVRLPSGILPF